MAQVALKLNHDQIRRYLLHTSSFSREIPRIFPHLARFRHWSLKQEGFYFRHGYVAVKLHFLMNYVLKNIKFIVTRRSE